MHQNFALLVIPLPENCPIVFVLSLSLPYQLLSVHEVRLPLKQVKVQNSEVMPEKGESYRRVTSIRGIPEIVVFFQKQRMRVL